MKKYLNVKEYEFLNPSIIEINYLVNCASDNCEDSFFDWFVFKCVFNIKFINVTNDKGVIFQVTLRYGECMAFESDELDIVIKNMENKVLYLIKY